ncbi:MAG TPA: hypothetical protein VGO60_10800, partial [Iamia sp.]|nr:hypothetical protein [Iamia sp.]
MTALDHPPARVRDLEAGAAVTSAPTAPRLVTLPTRVAVHPDARPTRLRVPRGIERLAGVAVLVVVWEVAARVGWLDTDTLAG